MNIKKTASVETEQSTPFHVQFYKQSIVVLFNEYLSALTQLYLHSTKLVIVGLSGQSVKIKIHIPVYLSKSDKNLNECLMAVTVIVFSILKYQAIV